MYWDYYGLFGIGEFDSIGYDQTARYQFKIFKKNYRDVNQYSFLCGKNPAVLKYLSDDPFGIKGSELDITLINIDDLTPLSLFYAEEDDTFKIEFKVIYDSFDKFGVPIVVDQVLFTGYMIPEDSNEVMTDIGHEISLAFTDNLGTLKNITFDEAAKYSPSSAANLRLVSANVSLSVESGNLGNRLTLFSNINGGSPSVGDYVVLNDTPVGDVAYTIIKITTSGSTKTLFVREPVLPFAQTSGVKLAYVTGTNPYNRIKLADALRICLHATNQNLSVDYAGQLTVIAEVQTTDWLNAVYVDGRTFKSDANNFMSCYDVLQKICERFQVSIFMANGKWNLVRWHELRYANNIVFGRNYNSYIVSQGTGSITKPKQYSAGRIEEGIEQSIQRPYNFYIQKFDYKADQNLIYNGNFQILGAKLREYTQVENSITYTYKEYEAEGFDQSFNTPPEERFIQIKTAIDFSETYLVVKNTGGFEPISKPIEVKKGDKLILKFRFQTQPGQTGPGNVIPMRLRLVNGVTTINTDIIKSLSSGDNTSTPIDIEFTYQPTLDGLLYLRFQSLDTNTYYTDLSLIAESPVNGSLQVNGQEHKGFVNRIVKNNETKEISVDDTSRNTIFGTLFLNAFQNLIQVRTLNWQDGYSFGTYRLGEITTKQQMDWKYSQRLKFEGKLLGIITREELISSYFFDHTTLLQAIIFGFKNDLNFIFGKAEFNFREDTINATFFEMWKDSEASNGITNPMLQYLFKYLYK